MKNLRWLKQSKAVCLYMLLVKYCSLNCFKYSHDKPSKCNARNHRICMCTLIVIDTKMNIFMYKFGSIYVRVHRSNEISSLFSSAKIFTLSGITFLPNNINRSNLGWRSLIGSLNYNSSQKYFTVFLKTNNWNFIQQLETPNVFELFGVLTSCCTSGDILLQKSERERESKRCMVPCVYLYTCVFIHLYLCSWSWFWSERARERAS